MQSLDLSSLIPVFNTHTDRSTFLLKKCHWNKSFQRKVWTKHSHTHIFSCVKYGRACCLEHPGRISAAFLFWSFAQGFNMRMKKKKDNKCVSFSFFLPLILISCSWTWWDRGRTVTHWREQMDPNLHGRSSLLCDCFSALCFFPCLSIVSSFLLVLVHCFLSFSLEH